jgi:membrane protein YqaA with SNARE-associated domain
VQALLTVTVSSSCQEWRLCSRGLILAFILLLLCIWAVGLMTATRACLPCEVSVTDVFSGSTALWGLFASAFISSTIAPGGSEAVLAMLVHQGEHPSWLLLASATVGNTLGAMTTVLLGYWAGIKYPADHPTDASRHKAVVAVRRWGALLLLLSWLPLVGDGLCFAAGWLRLPYVISLIAIFLGKLARYAAIIWIFS